MQRAWGRGERRNTPSDRRDRGRSVPESLVRATYPAEWGWISHLPWAEHPAENPGWAPFRTGLLSWLLLFALGTWYKSLHP